MLLIDGLGLKHQMFITWQFFVTFSERLGDPFKGCQRDLQLEDEKVTAWITW